MPIKTAIMLCCFAGCASIGTLAHLAGPRDDQPPSALQRLAMWGIRTNARVMLFLLGFHWIKTKGTPVRGAQAPIVVSNHIHLWEVLYLFSVYGPSAVSRKENAAIPGFGRLLRLTRGLLVDRASPTSRTDTLRAISDRGHTIMKDDRWPQVLIFPEGTTTNGKAVCTFKVGAFAAGLPVQPIAVRYKWRFFDPCWSVDGPGMLGSIMRMLAQFNNTMEVSFLPVYTPNDAERANPKLYARNVRDLIARELGLPGSHHSAEDALLQVQAIRARIPLDRFNTDMQTMHDLLNLDFEGARELLSRFGAAHSYGSVNFDAFCKFLKLPPSEEVQALFDAFDPNLSGVVDLRGLVLGLSALNARGTDPQDIIHRAWKVFDAKEAGHLSIEEMVPLMQTVFPSMLKEDIEAIFVSADTNKDGKLTLTEFDAYLSKHPEYVALAKAKLELAAKAAEMLTESLMESNSDANEEAPLVTPGSGSMVGEAQPITSVTQ